MSWRTAREQLDLFLPPCELELRDRRLARVTHALVDLRCTREHGGQALPSFARCEQPDVVRIGERRGRFGDVGFEGQVLYSNRLAPRAPAERAFRPANHMSVQSSAMRTNWARSGIVFNLVEFVLTT